MLDREAIQLDKFPLAGLGTVDLAVDAIEVADLVEVQVHPDRNPARPAAHHRINVTVLLETPRMSGKKVRGRSGLGRVRHRG